LEKDAPFSRTVERAGQILYRQFSAGCTTNMSGFDFRPDLIFDRHSHRRPAPVYPRPWKTQRSSISRCGAAIGRRSCVVFPTGRATTAKARAFVDFFERTFNA
jgi:hypothetical protein